MASREKIPTSKYSQESLMNVQNPEPDKVTDPQKVL